MSPTMWAVVNVLPASEGAVNLWHLAHWADRTWCDVPIPEHPQRPAVPEAEVCAVCLQWRSEEMERVMNE